MCSALNEALEYGSDAALVEITGNQIESTICIRQGFERLHCPETPVQGDEGLHESDNDRAPCAYGNSPLILICLPRVELVWCLSLFTVLSGEWETNFDIDYAIHIAVSPRGSVRYFYQKGAHDPIILTIPL